MRELRTIINSLISTIEFDVERIYGSSNFGFYEKWLEICGMESNNLELVKIKIIERSMKKLKFFSHQKMLELIYEKLHSPMYKQILEIFLVNYVYQCDYHIKKLTFNSYQMGEDQFDPTNLLAAIDWELVSIINLVPNEILKT